MDEDYENYMEKIDKEGLGENEFEEEEMTDQEVGLEDDQDEIEMSEIQDV